jgi:hypothetical protein
VALRFGSREVECWMGSATSVFVDRTGSCLISHIVMLWLLHCIYLRKISIFK